MMDTLRQLAGRVVACFFLPIFKLFLNFAVLKNENIYLTSI